MSVLCARDSRGYSRIRRGRAGGRRHGLRPAPLRSRPSTASGFGSAGRFFAAAIRRQPHGAALLRQSLWGTRRPMRRCWLNAGAPELKAPATPCPCQPCGPSDAHRADPLVPRRPELEGASLVSLTATRVIPCLSRASAEVHRRERRTPQGLSSRRAARARCSARGHGGAHGLFASEVRGKRGLEARATVRRDASSDAFGAPASRAYVFEPRRATRPLKRSTALARRAERRCGRPAETRSPPALREPDRGAATHELERAAAPEPPDGRSGHSAARRNRVARVRRIACSRRRSSACRRRRRRRATATPLSSRARRGARGSTRRALAAPPRRRCTATASTHRSSADGNVQGCRADCRNVRRRARVRSEAATVFGVGQRRRRRSQRCGHHNSRAGGVEPSRPRPNVTSSGSGNICVCASFERVGLVHRSRHKRASTPSLLSLTKRNARRPWSSTCACLSRRRPSRDARPRWAVNACRRDFRERRRALRAAGLSGGGRAACMRNQNSNQSLSCLCLRRRRDLP